MSTAQRTARAPLDLGQLVEIARTYACHVTAGTYPQLRFDPEKRWHERIHRDDDVDVWVISWTPTQGTLLHDHAGSSGAFSVVSGELSEQVVTASYSDGAGLIELPREAGESTAFGPRYVHDVRNLSNDNAVSVHVYSPPLRLMNYYEVSESALIHIGELETDDPEAEFSKQAS